VTQCKQTLFSCTSNLLTVPSLSVITKVVLEHRQYRTFYTCDFCCNETDCLTDLILTADVIEQLNHLNSYSLNMIVSHGSDLSQSNAAVADKHDVNVADSTDDV